MVITPNGRLVDAAAGPNNVPTRPRHKDSRAPERDSLNRWVKRLPDDTPIRFVPNPKKGKSAARYATYGASASLGDYRRLNPSPEFIQADLLNDLQRGLASLPPALWA